jgi:thymidylate synthase (FAD)
MDCFDLIPNREIKCLDKGVVALIDAMPRVIKDGETCDNAIAEAARVSYNSSVKKNTDRDLIRYLMRHRHTSPLEMIEFKFYVKSPLFVVQQWLRHRMASVNQESGRYSVLKDEFWTPDYADIRIQSNINKQISAKADKEDIKYCNEFSDDLEYYSKNNYDSYLFHIEKGIAKEQARCLLGSNLYTSLYWKIDLHNLLHFIALRSDKHAQPEIQVYSNAIYDLIKPLVPITIEAFDDYHTLRNAITLTALEIEAIKNKTFKINSQNNREVNEWLEKKGLLGL